eukprot:scaffold2161_cov225-Prasinococcus_capsulatus_cf.AAC.2
MSMIALRAVRTEWTTRGAIAKLFPARRTHAPRTAALCVYVRRCTFVRDTGYLLAHLCLYSTAVVAHGPRGVKAKAFRASCTHARTRHALSLDSAPHALPLVRRVCGGGDMYVQVCVLHMRARSPAPGAGGGLVQWEAMSRAT